ncbi:MULTISPECIES: TetR/AcrR family transcriptional regulator [Pseudomonas]|uniref:TetR/AcrR family transcriptional regulator n=1 Tax=Pseudomonas sessilinigenes TaxID=658629 RepID=A0ABX8MUD1_9PSED|nr:MULTISPECIES: TetR/AcrR family transcriptional regulator [Pseudomonas]AZC23852.1 Transcriptional regulator, AcrR family [Pseudomonas sessilinigenes]QXH42832.1 TetR/AcrR family transcriptional regulator [Pseudomonas sessilinigenes]UMZ14127.1 TetR/AcrR family transcriptional regulator [Pseudomonas sp. MPFS]
MRTADPYKAQHRRRQILGAAVECFARHGFHATSTAQICAAAGMSPGNLFHYFPSKAAIIAAIAEQEQDNMLRLFERWSAAEDALGAIEELALAMMALSSDPLQARISIEVAAEATRNPQVGALFAANEAQVKAGLAVLLERGMAAGQVDPQLDPGKAAVWLVALTEGAIARVVLEPGFKAREHQPMLRQIIRRFLRPQPLEPG